ncbi:hypothetical protein BH11BAC1_BH11BAC1_20150 [soil metagenome]
MDKIYRILLIFYLLTALSCRKTEEKCIGNTGGNLILKVFLRHEIHDVVNLKNYRDTVYIKYNVKEFPGSDLSKYDQTIIGEWPGDYVSVTGLKCGNYFVYGTGYESAHGYRVKGGIPFSTEQKNGEISLIIPVSE